MTKQQPQPSPETIMLASESARCLGVSVETLRAWADSGKINSQRTAGGFRIFLASDVEAMRKERESKRGAA